METRETEVVELKKTTSELKEGGYFSSIYVE